MNKNKHIFCRQKSRVYNLSLAVKKSNNNVTKMWTNILYLVFWGNVPFRGSGIRQMEPYFMQSLRNRTLKGVHQCCFNFCPCESDEWHRTDLQSRSFTGLVHEFRPCAALAWPHSPGFRSTSYWFHVPRSRPMPPYPTPHPNTQGVHLYMQLSAQ